MPGNYLVPLFVEHCFLFFKVFSLAIILISLLSYSGHTERNLYVGLGMEEMMFNAHQQELPPMDFPLVNYEELLRALHPGACT